MKNNSSFLSETLKISGVLSFKYVSKIAIYLIMGGLINIVLGVSQWELISSVYFNEQLTIYEWACSITIQLFVVSSLPVYFLVGQRQGISHAIFYIVENKKEEWLFHFVKQLSISRPDLFEGTEKLEESMTRKAIKTSSAVNNLPGILNVVFEKTMYRLGVLTSLNAALASVYGQNITLDQKVERVAHTLTITVPDDFMEPDWVIPGIILSFNIGLFFL